MAKISKPIIAVDVDEVLVPHFQDLIDWYNDTYGTKLVMADNHPTDTTNWGTKSVEEAVRRVHNFYETGVFKQAVPFAEAKAAVRKLAERYKLVVVTARDTILEEATRQWLSEHFEEFFAEAHFTAQYSLEGKSRSKADVCVESGASYLVDDDLSNILKASALGVKGILFADYPWSQADELPANVTRCLDWEAVLEYFDGRDN
jgi:uncharacterized HAD superfamily protein